MARKNLRHRLKMKKKAVESLLQKLRKLNEQTPDPFSQEYFDFIPAFRDSVVIHFKNCFETHFNETLNGQIDISKAFNRLNPTEEQRKRFHEATAPYW